MKKLLLSALVLTLSAFSFAFDFGGSLGNITKFQDTSYTDGLALDQKNYATLWTKIPFKATSNYFFTQGRYQFEYDDSTQDKINAIDFDSAYFYFSSSNFELKAGRFNHADLSALVYNQSGDGAELSYSIPSFNAGIYGFYTGLLNSQFITINDSDYTADTDKVYDFCAKYFVSGARVSLPSFLGEQTLSFEAMLAARLEGVKYDRLFAEGSLEGPVPFVENVFYDVTGVLGLSKYDDRKAKVSNLSKANIYFYPGVKDAQICLNAVYTTGTQDDSDASTEAFLAFTSTTAVNSINSDEFSSVFLTGLSASIKPFDSVLASAGFDAVFSTNSSKIKYSGFQYNAGLDYQILSDVYTGAAITQYFDKSDSDINKTAISIKAVILF